MGTGDPRVITANVIRIALGFLGILAVVLIMYAGWLWMTAKGEADKIEKAKKVLISAVIGLLIILSAFGIATFILNKLVGATGGAGGGGGPCDPACGLGQCCVLGSCEVCPAGGPGIFYIEAQVPHDSAVNMPRNVKVKFTFSANVDALTADAARFKVSNGGGAIAGAIAVAGDRIIFTPDAACPPNPCDSAKCFAASDTITVEAVNGAGGILSVGSQTLNCGGRFKPCAITFKTGDYIDCEKPTVDFFGNQICVDTNNIINATASDDSGIDNIEFFVDAGLIGQNVNFGNDKDFTTAFTWDSTGKIPGTAIALKATTMDLAENMAEKNKTATLRPAHCCDGLKNEDETGTDCGGSCAACAGAACGVNLNDSCAAVGDCSINNDKCSSGFCDCGGDAASCGAVGYGATVASCCLCQTKPVIYWVAPEGGFCRDVGGAPTNTPCQNDADCGGGTCDSDTPNGAEGNFVTIGGRNFGDNPGKVLFQKSGGGEVEAVLANTVNPNCVGAWQDDQIIVVVPAVAASGFIKIVDVDNNEETTNDSFGPAIKDFQLNTIIRPGLCKLTPDSGKAKDELVYDGIGLLGSTARFGKSSNFFDALSSDFTVGDQQGKATVPYLQTGKTTAYVSKTNIASNYINFTKNKEAEIGLRIESFEPLAGKAGQYVTIYGSGFGNNQGASKVYFKDKEADYQFPDVCADSVWSNNQIIVKVPGGSVNGNYIIKVEVDSIFADTSALAPSKFNINSALPLAPSLCKVKPIIGPSNSEITLWGEYFGTFINHKSKVRFNLNHDQSSLLILLGPLISWGPDGKADKIEALVHNEAITGPIRVVNDVLVGNGINFTVGNCAKDDDCGGGNVCCPAGTSKSGRCEIAGADKYENCYEDIKSSVYEWEFSTKAKLACDANLLTPQCEADDAICLKNGFDFCDVAGGCVCAKGTPAESCMGYGQGQCADQNCPNSPGKCSGYGGGNPKTVGDCGNAYCNNKYSSCSGNCEYDSGLNKCKLSGASCEDLISGKVNYTVFDAEGADALIKIPVDGIATEGTNKVYYEKGVRNPLSNVFIPVDTSKTYYIYGRFKSVGTGKVCTVCSVVHGINVCNPVWLGPPKNKYKFCTSDPNICAVPETCQPFQSRLYFGLAPYDENKVFIGPEKVLRGGNDEVITGFSNTEINVNRPISGWHGAGVIAGQRSLGFYYDGDTSKLPGYVWLSYPSDTGLCSTQVSDNYYCPDANMGAYNGTGINGSQIIKLNQPLPFAVTSHITNATVVKNHWSGSTYMYSAASNSPVPWTWENIAYNAGGITGEAWNSPANKFRIGTKYVKLMWLLNYQQSADEEIRFDDIVFSSQECKKVNGISIWQINTGGVSCPGGTYMDTNGWCTVIKSRGTAGQPATCSLITCPSGFSCENKQCVVSKEVCPAGSSCNAGHCEAPDQPACECCCHIGYDAQDCCVPLKCTGECGSDRTADNNQFGYCSGCAAVGATAAAHDAACNCSGHSGKFCDISGPHPEGICSDCARLSTAGECANHSTACCVDAKNGSKCGSGDGTLILGGYCAYYSCNTADPYDCQGPESTGHYKGDASCKNQCKAPDVPGGDTCYNKDTDHCDLTCAIGYNCLGDSGCLDNNPTPPPPSCGAGNTSCLCCCNPTNDQCGSINTKLSCMADKMPCSGGSRGLCCGCAQDSECGDPDNIGCSSDSCCRPRPTVESNYPADDSAGICRNTLITATFNEEMEKNSFSGNVIVAGDYGSGQCPQDTQFLAGVDLSDKNFLAKLYYKIVSLFKTGLRKLARINVVANAYTPPEAAHNYCAVTGTVGGYTNAAGKSVMTFKVQKPLDAHRKYYVIIKGDDNVNDGESKGVLSKNGIGMKGDVAEAALNGMKFINAHLWSFDTSDKICELSYVAIDPPSYLFQKAGATKEFQAYPKSSDNQNITAISGMYNWRWNWSSENSLVAEVANSDSDKQIVTAKNVKDGKTVISATAAITEDSVLNPSTMGKSKTGKADVYVLLCENPWPPIPTSGIWEPWSDDSANCTITGDGCSNTNYELYYCRDAGGPGTADDLPAVLSGTGQSVIRGTSLDKNILKEIYYFREGKPGANSSFEAKDLKTGGIVKIEWLVNPDPNVIGYKLYYGITSGSYSKTVTLGLADHPGLCAAGACKYEISGLTGGIKYYFALTSYYKTGAESDRSAETSATPTDKTAPAAPADFLITSASAKGDFDFIWKANSESDLAGYKIYYGTSPGVYGASEKLDKATEAAITGLTYGNKYYVALTAYDASGNESAKSREIIVDEKTYRDLTRLADMKLCKDALEAFKKDKGHYPGPTAESVPVTGQMLGDDEGDIEKALKPYLSTLPKDPLHDGSVYYYAYDPRHNTDLIKGSCAADGANGAVLAFKKAETAFIPLNKDTCSGGDMHINLSSYNIVLYPYGP